MIKNRILYEDNDIIVCHKPSGIATQTARVGQADMASEIANYLAAGRPGREHPYVGVAHRLDQPVEGILVFALNSRAAARLGRQISENRVEKYYLAMVCGRRFESSGKLTDYLVKDGGMNKSRVVAAETKDAKKATLDYRIVAQRPCAAARERSLQVALAEIRLHTGRHHQIRVQMSHAGMSLLGDRKYADPAAAELSERLQIKEVALCAYRLSFAHPATGRRMAFEIRPEGQCFREEFWQNYAEYAPHNEP